MPPGPLPTGAAEAQVKTTETVGLQNAALQRLIQKHQTSEHSPPHKP